MKIELIKIKHVTSFNEKTHPPRRGATPTKHVAARNAATEASPQHGTKLQVYMISLVRFFNGYFYPISLVCLPSFPSFTHLESF